MLDTCYEMATNLPAEIADNSVVSGSFGTVKLGEIKMFEKCTMKGEMKLWHCQAGRDQDVREVHDE